MSSMKTGGKQTMKKAMIALTITVILSLALATPVFAQAPDKNQDSIAPGLHKATINHCCNPGHNGPANAAAVFEAKYGFTHRY